jgi:putative nucleotidyltransferase with HDIG domain
MAVVTAPQKPEAAAVAAGPAGKTLPPELQKAMSRVTDINTLPEVTTKIVQIVEDPKATAHDLNKIVRTDPALATKILKVVNSAFYGLPSQIASLDRAILMLGMSAVKNIALASSIARLFKAEALSEQFAARDLWRHCIAVGVAAKMIANGIKYAPADEAFVAGLVHDMGLLVEQQLFPDKLREVAERCATAPQDFCKAEAEIIGADHQTFGAALAGRWKFPPTLRNAITYHHDPGTLPAEHQRFATLIYVADTIACQGQHGLWLTAQVQPIDPAMLDTLKLSQGELDDVVANVPGRLAEAEAIFTE